MTYHFLFEQSGTFKKVCLDAGLKAFDYDICDDFGQTDYRMDLFAAIDDAYDGEPTFFDGFGSGDFVFAFFPCIRFSSNFELLVTCHVPQYRDLPVSLKCDTTMRYHTELHQFYLLITKLVLISQWKGFKLVIENPYHGSYLRRLLPFKPSVVIDNRREYGDCYVKPTAFWFFNCEPLENGLLWPRPNYPKLKVQAVHGFLRSRITPFFAAYFLANHVFPSDLASCLDPERYLDLPEYLEGGDGDA